MNRAGPYRADGSTGFSAARTSMANDHPHERLDASRLASLLAALPESTRRIFVLHKVENIDKALIAESFGLSAEMVNAHIVKALITLHRGMARPQ